MFDIDTISDLDAAGVADALAASRVAVMAAEADQLALAAHWADLHAPEFVVGCDLLPGAEGVKRLGADGCPEMAEFAGAELAALIGRSTASGEALVADAVNLRHRHPLLWRAIHQGVVRVWLAARVARRCAAARLSAEQALWVDAQVAPYVEALPPGRFLSLVEAKIIEADPAAAGAREEAERLARFVRVGRSDGYGLRTLVARARAGDVTVLVAVIDRLAAVLAERGDPDPVEVRRASALRLLADPARALELLASAALAADTTPPDMPAHTVPLAAGALRADLHETEVPRPTSHLLQPVCVFIVHTTREALAAGGGASGAARVEDVGPQTLAAVRAWLGDAAAPMRIRVRPVLDPTTIPPVDRYEIPAAMRQAVEVLNPYEVFPYGTLPSSRCDGDHVAPYRRGPDGEPAEPGQTRWEGLAATSRFHHRLKTHGRWRLYTPEPGEYWWRTPQGHWFQVGPAGTRHHGRDPACDRRWLQPA